MRSREQAYETLRPRACVLHWAGNEVAGGSQRMRRRKVTFRAEADRMLTKYLGPRYGQLLRNWIPTAVTWGSVGAVGLVWATDWRLILDYVPWINGKFKKDD
ncbi:cytochrome b-c1 complex subunit 10 [Anolis carolinensis]|uniref:cytochrome b-c1 complex subunit 10 n=1 Tax=Anolis carolinensis TaxID=28377 RepID=UPI002F2B5EB5